MKKNIFFMIFCCLFFYIENSFASPNVVKPKGPQIFSSERSSTIKSIGDLNKFCPNLFKILINPGFLFVLSESQFLRTIDQLQALLNEINLLFEKDTLFVEASFLTKINLIKGQVDQVLEYLELVLSSE
ncbi:MAG: hypothetical protein ABIA74_04340 [bacterium]